MNRIGTSIFKIFVIQAKKVQVFHLDVCNCKKLTYSCLTYISMSQGEPHQLSIGRLQRRLEAAERLNRSYQDQIDHMKQIISEICAMHDLDPPDLRYAHYVPIRRTEEYERQGEQEDIDGNQSTELTQQLISEMVVNSQRKGRRHSLEAKKFFSAIFLQSPKAYHLLEQALPVPNHKTLTRFAKEPINRIRERIENVDRARESMRLYKAQYELHGPVPGVLAVDACSHESYIPPKSETMGSLAKRVQLEEFLSQFGPVEGEKPPTLKYAFVFYFQPLLIGLPCFPVHVTPETHGAAQDKHLALMDRLTQIFKEEGYVIVMKCSDGDNKYYQSSKDSYKIITKFCGSGFEDVEQIALLGPEIKDGVVLFGSDMLHVLKNARTRLLYRRVSTNVRYPHALDVAKIKKILEVPRECFEMTDLGKMVDAFPILLFTFKNVQLLFSAGEYQEAMFFLVFAMFHGFFRADCDHVTRLGIGITFIRSAQKYLEYVENTTKDGTCRCLEVYRIGAHLTMFQVKQLERMIVTVTTALVMLLRLENGTIIGMDRLSTHPLENFFGHLRVFCSSKHTYDNIAEKMARTQFIQLMKNELQLASSINKRLNTAGQRIKIDNETTGFRDIDFSTCIMALIDWGYCRDKLGVKEEFGEHQKGGEILINFLATLKIPGLNVSGKYSGVQILNRLIINSRSDSQEQEENSQ